MAPSAICIGAQKAGTTALYEYLKLHPQVLATEVKELDFFNCNSNYANGLCTYYRKFPKKSIRSIGKITLDITPGYLSGAERAAARIATFSASIKLIALLRNPIDRAFSAWQMYRNLHRSNREWFGEWMRKCGGERAAQSFQRRSDLFGNDFVEDIREEMEFNRSERSIEMPILRLGEYERHLSHYYKHFNRDQILILWSEAFRRDRLGILRQVESYLGLRPFAWKSEDLTPRFAGKYEEIFPPPEARELLSTYYAPRNEALFSLVGTRTHWS